MRGTIVKGIAGFYYVKTGDVVYECKARGIFKKNKVTPFVGDLVEFEALTEEEGIINQILPRKNIFIRPPIANVDCFVVTAAFVKPAVNYSIIDRFLVMAEKSRTDAVLCMNKKDLASEAQISEVLDIYEGLYPIVMVSGKSGEGITELETLLQGKQSALAGPSGVGKSTLLNQLQANLDVETGAISEKTSRGKHTTRHVELFEMDYGGLLFDTPGFTSFDILEAEVDELHELYPEFVPYIGGCRYDDCRHMKEPDCRIREALEAGKIHESRYHSYMSQYMEIQSRKKY